MAKSDIDIIKKPNMKSSFTEDNLTDLIICMEDPLYFMRTFVKIQHPMKGAVPFELYPFQVELVEAFHGNRNTIALTARQMGKALALDTPILTPTGFTTMGDLKVGDTIYGADGKPTTINFITDTMHDRTCYAVEFAHGETIIADAEHLWTISVPLRRGTETRTVNTREMIDLHAKYKKIGQSISIAHTQQVEFDDQESPTDPYMFGVWLGDGDRNDGRITCHVDDYPHYSAAAASVGFETSAFRPDKRRPTTGNYATPKFQADLRAMGVLRGLKRIPEAMLLTGWKKRLRLLQGLMDTDGTVEKNGVCRFYQSDLGLIEQVRFLLSSLGIKSTLRVKKTTHKDCFILTFATSIPVCTLPRKLERLAALKGHQKNQRIYVKSIVETESVPVRCLQVTNEDHLFLCGTTLIPTHNTTCAAAYLLWKAIFTPDCTILITANKLSQALEIMDRVRYAYENLPDFIRAGITEYNKGTVSFDNGSKITARATSADAGRGLSITLLYLDEFAFVPPNKAQEFWTSIQPVLSTGGSCIITSTPKSDEDQFAQIWKGANDCTDEFGNPTGLKVGKNNFFPVNVPWHKHPERDEAWAKPFRESLGEARFRQEFECDFVTDDLTLINPMCLARMVYNQPEFYTGTVRWFKMPEANKTYLVGLDPSVGAGGDAAAIQVFELPGMIQVAEWQHNLTVAKGQVRVLLQILHFLDGVLREDPNQHSDPEIFWTVENNTIGEHVLAIIEDTGEERFPGMFVSEKKRKGTSRRFRKGMLTTNASKLAACARFKSLVESDRCIVNSRQIIRELKAFVGTDSGIIYKAKPGEHDDLVMAALLCVRMLDTVGLWGGAVEGLKEHISEDELFDMGGDSAMPVVL